MQSTNSFEKPADMPEDLRDDFEERAAILEHEAKLPRHIAERKAWLLTLEKRYQQRKGTNGD